MIWNLVKGILIAIGIDFWRKKETEGLRRKVSKLERKAAESEDKAETAKTELKIIQNRQEEEKKIEQMTDNEKDDYNADIADRP